MFAWRVLLLKDWQNAFCGNVGTGERANFRRGN